MVEYNLAKVGVEGSNPFARSSFSFYEFSFHVLILRPRVDLLFFCTFVWVNVLYSRVWCVFANGDINDA